MGDKINEQLGGGSFYDLITFARHRRPEIRDRDILLSI